MEERERGAGEKKYEEKKTKGVKATGQGLAVYSVTKSARRRERKEVGASRDYLGTAGRE
jgi:hypothetical protein